MTRMTNDEMSQVYGGKTKKCGSCLKTYKTKTTYNLHWLLTLNSYCKVYITTHPW